MQQLVRLEIGIMQRPSPLGDHIGKFDLALSSVVGRCEERAQIGHVGSDR